jgi:DNA-directed RNA polymerase subunit RPC12/RpoP
MNPISIQFRCLHCRARIKTSVQMIGQRRNCPGCGHHFVIPRPVHEDVGPILVLAESEGGNDSQFPRRRSA